MGPPRSHSTLFTRIRRRAGILALWPVLLFTSLPWPAEAQTITTFAGGGVGDGAPATSGSLNQPRGVALDASGNLFIADRSNHRVRKVAAGTGIITTVAGTGVAGFGGDGGPATGAQLNLPFGVAVDGSGNLFIADAINNRIRKVAIATGIITTVAGDGTASFGGDGGPATSAQLFNPTGLVFDSSGNLFIVDTGNHRIRTVAAGTGIITTVAGTGVAGFSGDGGAAAGAQLNGPTGVTVDAGGNLFIADANNQRIRKVAGLGAAAVPAITALSVTSGTQGTMVTTTITGTNLAGATSADFGAGITVGLGANTATALTVDLTIGAGAATGARTFSVTTLAGTANSGAVTFTVLASAPPPPPPPSRSPLRPRRPRR